MFYDKFIDNFYLLSQNTKIKETNLTEKHEKKRTARYRQKHRQRRRQRGATNTFLRRGPNALAMLQASNSAQCSVPSDSSSVQHQQRLVKSRPQPCVRPVQAVRISYPFVGSGKKQGGSKGLRSQLRGNASTSGAVGGRNT